jgi:hypothetical protein
MNNPYFDFLTVRDKYGDQIDKYTKFIHQTDPLADDLVQAFTELPSGRGRKLLDTALDKGIQAVPEAPLAMRRLFEQIDDVPFWVDWDQLDLGGVAFMRAGLSGPIILGLYGLPLTYSSPAGSKALVFSGTLVKRAPRRLAETARFAILTCQPGGLKRFSEGFKTTIRVRMMHAQVRRLLLRSGRWKNEWGAPINQIFMAGTNLSLSLILIYGLRKLGWILSGAEREAIMQVWRYSAYLSGVHPELLCANESEARRLMDLILLTQGEPDDDSRALINALMGVRIIPRTENLAWMTDLYYGLSRSLLGSEIADKLQFPKTPWRFLLPALWAFVRVHEAARYLIPGGHHWAYKIGKQVWETSVDSVLAGKPAEFKMPEKLDMAVASVAREQSR